MMTTTSLIDKYKVTLHDGRMAVITPEYIEDGAETAFAKGFAFYASAVRSARNIVFTIQTNEASRIPESAFNQIRNRQYFDSLTHYHGNLLFVGINYDEKEKTHSCRIEVFQK